MVSIDIRPRSDANKINPSSTNNINVAIFSVNGFDATTVHGNTVRFGATGIEAAPIQGAIRDVNGDGRFEMVLRFAIPDTGIVCGNTSASLTGQTSQPAVDHRLESNQNGTVQEANGVAQLSDVLESATQKAQSGNSPQALFHHRETLSSQSSEDFLINTLCSAYSVPRAVKYPNSL